ncbi:MAG: hypothetical protein AAB922_04810 [Patescibacteria group bacterium]
MEKLAGDLFYIFLGALFLTGNQFIRWVVAVTLWQILTPAQVLWVDILKLISTFSVGEIGFLYRYKLAKWIKI